MDVSTEILQRQAESHPSRRRASPELGRGSRIFAAILGFALRKPLGAAGAVVIVLLVLVAIAGPALAPYDPYAQDATQSLRPPSAEHLMGTDRFGRDQFSRIIYGARVSLYVGLLSVIMGTVIGMVIGVASAYFGGKFDLVV